MIFFRIIATLSIFCLASCMETTPTSPLKTIRIMTLDSLPSGSGIVMKNDSCYIIGDDATGLYQLNFSDYQLRKIPVTSLDYGRYREPKPTKRDFECATLISWDKKEYLLAFGSGSTPRRNSMLMINTGDYTDHRILPVKELYTGLRKLTHTVDEAWNIEGATATTDDLFLLNRGNNLLIRMKLNDLLLYLLQPGSDFPQASFETIKLPLIQNHEARLSGACTLDANHLLFCATVEDTPDWYSDGPVLGSFIGIYSLKDKIVTGAYRVPDTKGAPLKEKVESLTVLRTAQGKQLELLAVGDNDDGTTNLIHLLLELSAD